MNVLRFFADASDIVGGPVSGTDTSGMEVGDIVVVIIRITLWVIGILSVAMIGDHWLSGAMAMAQGRSEVKLSSSWCRSWSSSQTKRYSWKPLQSHPHAIRCCVNCF